MLGVAALLGIAAVVRGNNEYGETDWRVVWTLIVIFLAGATVLCGAALVDRRTFTPFGWFIVFTSVGLLAVLLTWIWKTFEDDGSGSLERLGLIAIIALPAELLATLAALMARSPRLRLLVVTTICVTAMATGLSAYAVWEEDASAAFEKLIFVFWILAALGFLLSPVLQRATRSSERAAGGRVVAGLKGVDLLAVKGGPAFVDAVVRVADDGLTVTVGSRVVTLGADEVLLIRPH